MIITAQKEVTDWSCFQTSTSWTKLTVELIGSDPAVKNPVGGRRENCCLQVFEVILSELKKEL